MAESEQEIADEIFRRKRTSRLSAARLPIEEKPRILVRRAAGWPELFAWRLD